MGVDGDIVMSNEVMMASTRNELSRCRDENILDSTKHQMKRVVVQKSPIQGTKLQRRHLVFGKKRYFKVKISKMSKTKRSRLPTVEPSMTKERVKEPLKETKINLEPVKAEPYPSSDEETQKLNKSLSGGKSQSFGMSSQDSFDSLPSCKIWGTELCPATDSQLEISSQSSEDELAPPPVEPLPRSWELFRQGRYDVFHKSQNLTDCDPKNFEKAKKNIEDKIQNKKATFLEPLPALSASLADLHDSNDENQEVEIRVEQKQVLRCSARISKKSQMRETQRMEKLDSADDGCTDSNDESLESNDMFPEIKDIYMPDKEFQKNLKQLTAIGSSGSESDEDTKHFRKECKKMVQGNWQR